jgi:hypothetical protein
MNKFERITPEQAHFYKWLDPDKLSSEEVCRKATAFALIPCTEQGWEGWEEVKYYQDSPVDGDGNLKPTEFVYVLVNKSIPGMVKIGMTVRNVDERAKEISSATGVPTPWVPIYSFQCFNSYKLEQEIHEYLDAIRVNENREMFAMSSTDAIKIVKQLGEKYTMYEPS